MKLLRNTLVKVEINIPLLILLAAILVSATAVVYFTHVNRYSFVALQRLEHQRDKLDVEWGRLLLEESTLGSPRRVERKAKQSLQMIVPDNISAVEISDE